MHHAKAIIGDEDERSGELVALLNMINYAQAIASDLKLGTAVFHLQGAAHELSNEVQRVMQPDLANLAIAALKSGKVGRC